MVAIIAEPILGEPCSRAGVTVTGLLAGDQVVTLWRTTDGERVAVRGVRATTVNNSFYVDDFEVPLGRPVSYELEVLEGPDAGTLDVTADVVVDSLVGYVQDPLSPGTAVPVRVGPGREGMPLLKGTFEELTYESSIQTFQVMGSSRPVAFSGPRMAASGVPFSILTQSREENERMRALIRQAGLLIIRGLPSWGSRIPGSATYAAGSVTERTSFVGDDGPTRWETTGDIVRGSSSRVVTPLWTFQDVAEIFPTYAQKQLAANGRTYLQDQKDPSNS